MGSSIDISETNLLRQSEELLAELLRDHTTKGNIFWASDNYESLGEGYGYYEPITIASITGERGSIIQPRVLKSRAEQVGRTKDKAEVFTPSWVCNAQNNLIDLGARMFLIVSIMRRERGQPRLGLLFFPREKHGGTTFARHVWKSPVARLPTS